MLRAFIFFIFALSTCTSQALCDRVALVIGNANYKHAPKLTNPRNDAEDVSNALRTHGVRVIDGYDLDRAALERKVREFAEALTGAKVGLFFYAGHGLQVSGQNYLVPVDAKLATAASLDFEMLKLDLVHRTMEREAQTNIIFIDACRDNPLARDLSAAMGTRSAQVRRGLAPIEGGIGTLISFSTQPGNVALDGIGRNSPYAGALAKRIASASEDLSAMLVSVRNDVMRETERKQVPWEHSSLTGQFFFGTASSAKPKAPTPGSGEPKSSPATDLFTAAEYSRLKTIAERKGIPIQPFQFYRPSDRVSPESRRFVGIWLSDAGFERSGRQKLFIVSDVVMGGVATGFHGTGPRTARSTVATPASFFPLVGKISGNTLEYSGAISSTTVAMDPKGHLLLTETFKNGLVAKVQLRPAWTLVDAERQSKR